MEAGRRHGSRLASRRTRTWKPKLPRATTDYRSWQFQFEPHKTTCKTDQGGFVGAGKIPHITPKMSSFNHQR